MWAASGRSAPIRASDRDLRALAAIVSRDREDLPAGVGLPPSLLADLQDQIPCDDIWLDRYDSERQALWFLQHIRVPGDDGKASADQDPAAVEHWWACHWDSRPCSYPERTGDLRSVVTIADFYSVRQWHSTAMYNDFTRPYGGLEHQLTLCLPNPAAGPGAGPGWRTVRLILFRGPGPDFSERDRALLVLLRPHLHRAYLEAERRRHPVPRLTPGRTTCCACWPPGIPTPRSPGSWASRREPCVPTWKTSTASWVSPAAPPQSPAPSPTARIKTRHAPPGQRTKRRS